MRIEDIKGVGSVRAKKLKKFGYRSIEDIAKETPTRLSRKIGISMSAAKKIIKGAKSISKTKEKTEVSSVRALPRDEEFKTGLMERLLSSGDTENDLVEGIADEVSDIMEDDPSLRKELVVRMFKNSETKQRIIEKLVEKLQ